VNDEVVDEVVDEVDDEVFNEVVDEVVDEEVVRAVGGRCEAVTARLRGGEGAHTGVAA